MKSTRVAVPPPEEPIFSIRPGLQFSRSCLQVGGRHFELGALDNVHTKLAERDPVTRRAVNLALGGGALLIIAAPRLSPAGIVAGSLLLAALAAFAAIHSRRRPRRLELWANYHGHPSQLFVSDDWWLFTAVERYLKRALADAAMDGHAITNVRSGGGIPHPSAMHPARMHPSGTPTAGYRPGHSDRGWRH